LLFFFFFFLDNFVATPLRLFYRKRGTGFRLRGSLGAPRTLTKSPPSSPRSLLYTIESKHVLQLICIALSYIISADLRSRHFARLGRAWRRMRMPRVCALAVAPFSHMPVILVTGFPESTKNPTTAGSESVP
jgi:hypothetical protein